MGPLTGKIEPLQVAAAARRWGGPSQLVKTGVAGVIVLHNGMSAPVFRLFRWGFTAF